MDKQAILVIAHDQPELLITNLQLLDSEYFDFYIHIDKKTTSINLEQVKSACKVSDVNVYQEVDVRWGGISQMQCELFLLEKAVKKTYKYYHLISGRDMPIAPKEKIYDFFNNSHIEYIHFDNEEISKSELYRVNYYYNFTSKWGRKGVRIDQVLAILQRIIGINRNRNRNRNITFQKGAQWFSITNDFANYVLQNKEWIENTFYKTICCDELFMQTVLVNSPFKERNINNYNNDYSAIKRLINWKNGKPCVFTEAEYEQIVQSEAFWARKFDGEKYPEIIRLVKERLITN